MKLFAALIFAAVSLAPVAQGAWIKKAQNLACTQDLNEWGHGSSCSCPEATTYNQKIGECLSGAPYPILVSGVLQSKNALTKGVDLKTEYGTFHLIVKTSELARLQRADKLYFEAEGEFVMQGQRQTIIVDHLSWLE